MRTGAGTLLAIGLFAVAAQAHAYTHTASASADTIYVGCRSGVAAICDDGALTVVETSCTLTGDIHVNAVDGNDVVTVVRAAVAPTCNGSPTSISSLTYNGHYVDLTGGAGNDVLSGGTGDHVVFGSDGDDLVTTYSAAGYASGAAGEDEVRADTASNGWEAYGGSANDCVGITNPDPGSLPDVLDCGSHSTADSYIDTAGFSESNCESTVSDCP